MKHSVPASEVIRINLGRVYNKSRWLIHELLPARGRAVLFGAPKTGKSFLAVLMSHCISTGQDFMERTCKKASVLYMAFEDGEGIDLRMGVYLRHAGMDRQIFLQKGMAPFARPSPGHLRPVTRYIEDVMGEPEAPDIGLVVIDTVARSMVGSENDGEDWAFYQETVDLLAWSFPQACILLVHHENKSETPTPRGHTSLPAHMDAILRVTYKAKSNVGKLLIEGMKNGPSGYEFIFKLEDIKADLLTTGGTFPHATKIPVYQRASANAPIYGPTPPKLTRRDRILIIAHGIIGSGGKFSPATVSELLARELGIDTTDKKRRKNHGRVFRDDLGDIIDDGEMTVADGVYSITSKGTKRVEEVKRQQNGSAPKPNGHAPKDSPVCDEGSVASS